MNTVEEIAAETAKRLGWTYLLTSEEVQLTVLEECLQVNFVKKLNEGARGVLYNTETDGYAYLLLRQCPDFSRAVQFTHFGWQTDIEAALKLWDRLPESKSGLVIDYKQRNLHWRGGEKWGTHGFSLAALPILICKCWVWAFDGVNE